MDDLNVFSDFLADMGRASAVTEAAELIALIAGNGVTLGDGLSLWHANHGNLSATSDAMSVASLGAARSKMRLQPSPTNQEPLNIVPKFLLVSAAKKTLAEQLLTDIAAGTITDVNPFGGGRLTLLVEPRLDTGVSLLNPDGSVQTIAAAPLNWFVIASPEVMPFIELAVLDGTRPMSTAGAPRLESFQTEDVLGIKFRAVHDFGCWPVNYRAAFKNPGA
jgi:phage major head subunit gpT-like protein